MVELHMSAVQHLWTTRSGWVGITMPCIKPPPKVPYSIDASMRDAAMHACTTTNLYGSQPGMIWNAWIVPCKGIDHVRSQPSHA